MREPRRPHACDTWSEVFISPDAEACGSAAESVVCGHSLLVVKELATAAECCSLHEAATIAAEKVRAGHTRSEASGALSATLACRLEQPCVATCTDGRVRMPIVTFHRAVRTLCDELLLRALDLVDAETPELAEHLGRGLAADLRCAAQPLATSPLLTFTHNEPAINLYTAGGAFEPHQDLQSLTVLMPLVDADAFEGGGTAFWRAAPHADGDEMALLDSVNHDVATAPPALVLKPPRGTALLWGGRVTHAGLGVSDGERSVFVASCSRHDRAYLRRFAPSAADLD